MASLSDSTIISFAAAIICFISATQASNSGGITLDLIHRDSPSSPFYNASEIFADPVRKSIQRSKFRYSSLKSMVMKKTAPIEAPITNGGYQYLMKIKIGTPPLDVVALADTGSDVTWVQCQPCTNCFPQNSSLFDPTKSSSFQPVSCSSGICTALDYMGNGCDSQKHCLFKVAYGDMSYTSGNLAKETFIFESPSGHRSKFPGVAFGCSTDSKGGLDGASGVVGLGGGATSIIRQLGGVVGGVFSYCLTPINSTATGKISFGRNAIVKGPGLQKTPMKIVDAFYKLTLEAITIGKTRVNNTTPKSVKSDFFRSMIIDSGSTLTYLPYTIYKKVVTAMKKAVKGKRVKAPVPGISLCFKAKSFRAAPPITMHFSGADVRLSDKGTFLRLDGVVCSTFVKNVGLIPNIFGSLQQIDYEIGYNINANELSFLPADCERSR